MALPLVPMLSPSPSAASWPLDHWAAPPGRHVAGEPSLAPAEAWHWAMDLEARQWAAAAGQTLLAQGNGQSQVPSDSVQC